MAHLGDTSWHFVEDAVHRLESAWHGDGAPGLSQFVPPVGRPNRLRVLVELIKVDQEYHWDRGNRKILEDYLGEWPELSQEPELLVELLAVECLTRATIDMIPSSEELQRRFPELCGRIDLAAIATQARNEEGSDPKGQAGWRPLVARREPAGSSRTTDSSSAGTSSRLLRRLLARDEYAWQRFADLYGPLVHFWCRRFAVRLEDAGDVMQEVFTSVWSALPLFQHEQGRGRFRGWLWTITRNKITDYYRRQAAHPAGAGGTKAQHRFTELPAEPPEDPSDERLTTENKRVMHRAVEMVRAEFGDRVWQAFWGVAVTGQTASEVGATLGMSASAVRQAKSRVLRRLREEVGDLVS